MNWGALPEELRSLPQWVLGSNMDVAPYYVNSLGGMQVASVTDPSTWMTFDAVCAYALRFGMCPGFVITEHDPYVCIDTDNKISNPAHPDALVWYWENAVQLDSYTELSPSGRGLHTWIKAALPHGFKRHPFEIYPHKRYIRCTGWVLINSPIREAQAFATWFAARLDAAGTAEAIELTELEQEYEDDEILLRAGNASNKEKFKDLYEGRWEGKYPSQSEADFALISMLAFYSISNEQCRRLFRRSALGQRAKAQRNDYLNRSLAPIRARQEKETLPAIDISAMIKNSQRVVLAPLQEFVAVAEHSDPDPDWPPGLTGSIARFIYSAAPRPVKEVAIVAALGLMAGICGKAWHIPNSGLNMYIILVARSAIGKEAMHAGISKLCNAVSVKTTSINNFYTFNNFASGQALIKYCGDCPSFVNVNGEWGRKLRRFADDNAHDASMSSLRTAMLDLYQKSGPDSKVGGISYSNKDTTLESMGPVAYSMIGETTPKTFYQALTEEMMEDGFLSRFTVIDYNGERPELNEHTAKHPSPDLVTSLAQLSEYAQKLLERQHSILIGSRPEVIEAAREFERECDKAINKAGDDESRRQMWNRAALKAYRIAALLAVGNQPDSPVITEVEYVWALNIVRRDIKIMNSKLEEGDIGTDDNSQQKKLVNVLRQYTLVAVKEGYKIPKGMQERRIIPNNYLLQRCMQIAPFRGHKLGAREAIRQGIKSMIECGYMKEALPKSLADNFAFSGKAYFILDLPATS